MAKRKLEPMDHNTKSYTIVGFDTEFCAKHLGKDSFVLGTIAYPQSNGHDSEKLMAFEDPNEFLIELLRRKNRSVRFYAHNLSVDLANGIKPYIPDDYEFTVMKAGNRVIKATIEDTNRNQWSFFDSSQISGYASLAEIGDIIGVEKLDPKEDLKGCNCNMNISKEFKEYAKIDAKIVTEWMNNHLQPIINNKFNSKLDNTLAGTTMGIWRRNFQDKAYYVLDKELREIIRGAYNGGRTEVFKKGKIDNVFKYDVNSLYPYVYSAYYFPFPKYIQRIEDPSPDTVMNHMGKEGFIKATVKAPDDLHIPYLKYFDENLGANGKLIFPTGVFTDTWTLLEMRKAINLGYEIKNVYELVYSNQKIKPWSDFAKSLYKEKQRYGQLDKPAHYMIVKLLMNSLWGRFGVDPEGNEAGFVHFSENIDEIKEQINEMNVALTGQEADALRNGDLDYYFEPFDNRAPNYCHPEWAAYTTACARHELYKWFERVGLESVIYCDTDSVITTNKLPDSYISDDLGAMDLEFTGTFEAIREKGYITYKNGNVKQVVGSGINQDRFINEKGEKEGLRYAAKALKENLEIRQTIWGGPSMGGVQWGKTDEIPKELGSHWVPKRIYNKNGKSYPIEKSLSD